MNDLKRAKTSSKCSNKKKKLEIQDKMSENPDLPSILVELEDEIQRQLEEKAEKTNLSVRNVKNILQAVLTNEDVLKMVDDKEKDKEKSIYDLKLTRAKTKQLLGPDFQTPKKSVAEILNKEFPDDSSDEEYNPNENIDEIEIESRIGQRTRSKLCLTKTPLEVIEQAFIPPDITPDMYNTDCDNQDWLNFLKEFTQPLENVEHDDDDPEYTFIMDEEQEAATDKEELRMDRAVKVTKKELNELMSELFEYTQMLSSDDEEKEVKIEEKQPILMIPSIIIQPKKKPQIITEKQCLLIKQQLTQHIQLTLQHFIMSHNHPELDPKVSITFKEMLLNFDKLKQTNKIFKTKNLDISLNLMKNWEEKTQDVTKTYKKNQKNPLPIEIMKFMINTTPFIYPLLLPTHYFTQYINKQLRFTKFEDNLITMALYDIGETIGINYNEIEFEKLCVIIHESILPAKSPRLIFNHIKRIVNNNSNNPIKDLLKYGQVLAVDHFIIYIPKKLKTIKEQHRDLLPSNWIIFSESYKDT